MNPEETVEEAQNDDREVFEKSGFKKSLKRKFLKIARLEAENAALKKTLAAQKINNETETGIKGDLR